MNASGTYVIRGGFDKTMPGDKVEGLLTLNDQEDSGPPVGYVILSGVLRTKPFSSAPCAASDLRISRPGAVSFAIRSKLGTSWSFTGFLSGGAITGRHSLAVTPQKQNSAKGAWVGTRVHGPLAGNPAVQQAADALLATPEARARIAAFLEHFQPKRKQDE